MRTENEKRLVLTGFCLSLPPNDQKHGNGTSVFVICRFLIRCHARIPDYGGFQLVMVVHENKWTVYDTENPI